MEEVNRVCLLTGASGPLGTEFIRRCAGRYEFIAVHHLNTVSFATEHQEFVDPLFPERELRINDRKVYSIRADLRQAGEIDRTIAEAKDRFGRIDLLINGAAVRYWSGVLARGGIDCAEEVLQVNVIAPLRLSVGLAHALWSADPEANIKANRNVVNISSTGGLFVYPDLGQAVYGASKAALNHLTHHLASEFWDIGVRVNALAPDTFPGRVSLGDVIESILTLDNSNVTGQVVRLDQRSRLDAAAGGNPKHVGP